jgi:co-chaperonin GroES (HSP10)
MAREKPDKGEVIAVGPGTGKTNKNATPIKPLKIKPGQKVQF